MSKEKLELLSIDLVYENVESININKKYIQSLYIDGYRRIFTKIGSDFNWVEKYDDTLIRISNAITSDRFATQDLYKENGYEPSIDKTLRRTDIAGISLNYSDGSSTYFNNPWLGDSDYDNDGVKTYVGKRGEYLIVATRGENSQFNSSVDGLLEYMNTDSKLTDKERADLEFIDKVISDAFEYSNNIANRK